MSLRLLVAAGGTGGHVYPALAVAEAVRAARPNAAIAFAGGRRGIERELVPQAGFPLTRLPAAGLRGLGLLGAVRFAVAFTLALMGAAWLVLRLRPDLVLATGGYASAAPAMAAVALGRPLWLQEQNSVPGSTNRFLARFAERAFVAFEAARQALAGAKTVETLPNPVRAAILDERGVRPQASDYEHFGLDATRPTLLMFGGSRGAKTLNAALRSAWAGVRRDTAWQAVAQTGRDEWEDTRAVVERNDDASRARVLPYIDDMNRAYRVADLVVCRAGALTLAELSVLGKAAILVPFPYATDDHQTRNARAFAEAGAAVLVTDDEFDGDRLTALLREFEDEAARQPLREAAERMSGGRDAAAELAAALIERVEGKAS